MSKQLTSRMVKVTRGRVIAIGTAALMVVLGMTMNSQAAGGPFDPDITFTTSTTQATAHPDAQITITSDSDEELRAVTIDLPDGFWGSLAAASKCDYDDAEDGLCAANTKIGTIKAQALVDQSDVVLSGSVYLTEPHADFASVDPAWLSIKIDPEVGGVTSFDPIITPARAIARYATQSGKIGQPLGLRTQVGNIAGHPEFDVPTDVTDTNNRTIDFNLKKMTIDLKSDLDGPNPPLLTNPSSCATGKNFTATFLGHDGATPAATNIPYQSTGCANVKFRPADASFALSEPTTDGDGNISGVTGELEFPADSASILETKLRMPSNLTFNNLAFYTPPSPAPLAYCSPSAIPASGTAEVQYFDPSLCPVNGDGIIGTAEIETPLLPDPLQANVYLTVVGSLPRVIIHASHDVNTSNPAGLVVSIIGRASVATTGTCPTSFVFCPAAEDGYQISITKLPDTPVSKVTIDMAKPDGWRTSGLSAKLIATLPDYSQDCRPVVGFSTEFTSHSGATATYANAQSITGCDNSGFSNSVDLGTSAADMNQTDTTPSIPFTPDPSYCVFDDGVDENTFEYPAGCTSPATPASPLAPGIHTFALSDDGVTNGDFRMFTVQHPPSLPESDTTPPTVTLDTQPTDPTSDTTPTVDFSATGGPALFQCSLNDGAFLPCGSTTPGTSGSYTVDPADALIPNDSTYSIAVRAIDEAGNVSAAQTASFKVEVAFEPTFDVDLTTTAARAHPEMDVTITSGSHEDLKDLTLTMPDGFFGGLSAVPELCEIATAQAGGCTSSSQIGTVDTEAIVDNSTFRLPGTVHMTKPIQIGDPAGLYIVVPAKLQDVDMGFLTVPVRLTVRGNVQGLDSFATNIPDRVTPTNSIDGETEFDMRSITLKLRNNSAAAQPLLTNPSQCGASQFAASFTGDATPTPTTTSESVPFAATNCAALGFGPQLSMSLVDSTTGQAPGPSTSAKPVSANLTASLTSNPGDAGIKSVNVLLPKPVTIDISKLPIVCTVEQYNAGGAEGCPESAKVGTVTATSPLLREPLNGIVYLVKTDDPNRVLPRIVLALRGPISTDIIGTSSFENLTQIRTVFNDLPDVPLNSFSLSINKVISTRNEACATMPSEWNAIGSMGAHNGSAAGVLNPLSFTCATSGVAKFKNRGKKSTLTLTVTPPTGTNMKSVAVKLPKGLKLVKSKFTKKTAFKMGSRKLKTKCVKMRGLTQFTTSFCKKKATSYKVTFKAGSLTATKKVKKPKFKVTTVDGQNRKSTFVVQAK